MLLRSVRNKGMIGGMSKQSDSSPVWLRRLQTPARIDNQEAVAARFIYALRLIAAYQSAGRDPAAEQAVRMESVTAAVHAMELAHQLLRAWPESITVNRFCCMMLSHDEATIAHMINAAAGCDRRAFAKELADLVRPDRIERLWKHAVCLVGAEAGSHVPL